MAKDKYTSAEFRAAIKSKSITVGAKKGDKEKAHMLSVIMRIFKDSRFAIYHGKNELKFSPDRKFKFDYAIASLTGNEIRIGIEYEGLMSEKSGHTTVIGYTSNTEKYNLACILGWKVLRYTALNYKNLESDLKALINH